MAQSVVDEVCDQNLQEGRVTASERWTEIGFDMDAPLLCVLDPGGNDATDHLAEVKGLPPLDSRFAAGQGEK